MTISLYELIWNGSFYVKDYDTFAGCFRRFQKKLESYRFLTVVNPDISPSKISCSFELKFFDIDVYMSISQHSFEIKSTISNKSLPISKQFPLENITSFLKRLTDNDEEYLIILSPGLFSGYFLQKTLDETTNEIFNQITTNLLKIDILQVPK